MRNTPGLRSCQGTGSLPGFTEVDRRAIIRSIAPAESAKLDDHRVADAQSVDVIEVTVAMRGDDGIAGVARQRATREMPGAGVELIVAHAPEELGVSCVLTLQALQVRTCSDDLDLAAGAAGGLQGDVDALVADGVVAIAECKHEGVTEV